MKGTCSKCGFEGEVTECRYCRKTFCQACYYSHMRWEKKHEGLEPTIKREHLKRRLGA